MAASAPALLSVGLVDLDPQGGGWLLTRTFSLPWRCLSQGFPSPWASPSLTTFPLSLLQYDDGSGMKREATADDLIKVVEELTRIH